MKKILLVDDDSEFVRLIQLPLKKAGYQVSVAQDGMSAVSAIHKGQPDLVVLDIGLPCGDGVSVLKKVKQSFQTNSIPVIVLTGNFDVERKKEAVQLGVEAYLIKPCPYETLLAEIKRILD